MRLKYVSLSVNLTLNEVVSNLVIFFYPNLNTSLFVDSYDILNPQNNGAWVAYSRITVITLRIVC